MKNLKTLLFPALVLVLCPRALLFPQGLDAVASSAPQDIASRVSQLEAETQALRTEVEWLSEQTVSLPTATAAPTGMVLDSTASDAAEGNYVTREELPGEIKKFA
jgi:hypothetical protein